jgi:hypothetical protein
MERAHCVPYAVWNGPRYNPPYLNRNITKFLKRRQVETRNSSGINAIPQLLDCPSIGGDQYDERPQKRQRLKPKVVADNAVINQAETAEPSLSAPVSKPFLPNGNERGSSIFKDGILSSFLPAQKALMIEVLEIFDIETCDYEPLGTNLEVSCVRTRATLSIFTSIDSTSIPIELLRISQMGTIRTKKGPQGHFKGIIELREPFLIPAEHLMVNHKVSLMTASSRENGDKKTSKLATTSKTVFKLAESYTIQIWFEPVGIQPVWPPLRSASFPANNASISRAVKQGASIDDIHLITKANQIFNPSDQDQILSMTMKLGALRERFPYYLKMRARWSVPPRLRRVSLLKQAGGDKPQVNIRYYLGATGSKEVRKLMVRGFSCPCCLYKLASLDFLRFHIATNHHSIKINSFAPDVDVETIINMNLSTCIPSSEITDSGIVLQLRSPNTPFNLEAYLDGDLSWIISRKVPLASCAGGKPPDPLLSPAPSSGGSTSISEETEPDETPRFKRTMPVKLFRVPVTKTPMYDLMTRRVLKPGELLPADPSPDMSWQRQQHDDYIDEFTDVIDEEKDYLKRWDRYIASQRITSDCYMPAALLRFVTENQPWFSQRQSRRIEFGKHCAHLLRRRVITLRDMGACTKVLATLQIKGGENKSKIKDKVKGKGKEREVLDRRRED